MEFLLAFAPFLVFVVAERVFGPLAGLVSAAGVSFAMLISNWVSPGKTVKVLEVGTVLLFGGLAAFTFATGTAWSIFGVRLCIDAGLFLIVLVSIVIGRPFTLQYAREKTPREIWSRPEFLQTNRTITAVWAAAFALMVAADFVLLYMPQLPPVVGIGTTVVAIAGALHFTRSRQSEAGRSSVAKA